jgi:hypothetical protein
MGLVTDHHDSLKQQNFGGKQNKKIKKSHYHGHNRHHSHHQHHGHHEPSALEELQEKASDW